MKHYTIDYYEGEEEGRLDLNDVPDSKLSTINEAAMHVAGLKVPLSVVKITEWDESNLDGMGLPDIIGSCSLEEADEEQYESLP